VIRRFESYAFVPATPDEARLALAEVLAGCGRYIPEVLDSAIGWNGSSGPAELVWEHAFDSTDAYRRYMVHPYHADIIDRYVLPDSPERIVEPVTGAGLFGYHCGEPAFLVPPGGARRVVLLRLEPGDRATGAPGDLDERARGAAKAAGATCSSIGANTMASAWFDGETPLPVPAPKWTHVWELGFADLGALEHHLAHTGADLASELGAQRWTELGYEVTTKLRQP
jgi:hypothetical protein